MRKGNGYGVIAVMLAILVLLINAWWRGEQEKTTENEQTTKENIQRTMYENAWIVKMQDKNALIYKDGELHNYTVNSDEVLKEVLADVIIENNEVKNIRLKTDVISGKVLAVADDSIEIEGYGKVRLSENVAVIKSYGELENLEVKDVVVGYALQEFIVGNGEICGIIIDSELKVDNIRVLLMTDGYRSIFHDKVAVSSAGEMVVVKDNKETMYTAGREVVFDGSSFEQGERILIRTDDDAKIKLHSVKRSNGVPSYRGTFELIKTDDGIMIINELSLEEYLYSVLPSEMPASYGLEALKAQAVCARSYAYKQILNNSLGRYGAHVNDSSQYQVYNNITESNITIEAVDATKGQILMHDGEVAEAFYFSTSCGHTTDADIWEGKDISYVKGKLLDGSNAELILDTEEKFAEFIKNRDFKSYDMNFSWYRWEIQFSLKDLTSLVKKAGLEETIGEVKAMEVAERGTGGIVKKIKISGSKGSVFIEKEYTIRKFLNPQNHSIIRADNTTIDDFPLLPSAYFTADPIVKDKQVTGYHIYGGGFGHGAGMSQNGAKAMTDAGIPYDDVLEYFFEDISIFNCYSY